MHARTILLTAVMALALPVATRAQAPATPATPAPPTATEDRADVGGASCAPSRLSNPNARPGVTTGRSDSLPLSDRLAAGNGVLCPPSGVDPEIRAPTPEGGKMPVIPPPGAPGGNQLVQPK